MFIIPLTSNRHELEHAEYRCEAFNLDYQPTSKFDTYVILGNNCIIVAGVGTVRGKAAFQYRYRLWTLGDEIEDAETVGSIGLLGDYSNIDEAISKTLNWKKEKICYALNSGKLVEYKGQKIRANKHHWEYIEPIMCLFSDNPGEDFIDFLDVLRYPNHDDFEVDGTWGRNLSVFYNGEEIGLDEWYFEFAKKTIR